MVIGWPFGRYEDGKRIEGSPWSRVEQTQKHPRLPCLLVPQPAHAVLAGDLAAALLPEVLGEIPPDIRQAISMHDTGWAMVDAGQLQRLRSESSPGAKPAMPSSFLAASPEEAERAWVASIEYVAKLTPRGGWIVSRHFSLLAATTEKAHKRFLVTEEARRRHRDGGFLAISSR